MAEADENLKEDILKLLECPLCTHYMLPPVTMCLTGHPICVSCRLKTRTCPSCNRPFNCTRNQMTEDVIKVMKLPCKYRGDGCTKQLSYKNLLSHEHSCSYQSYRCILGEDEQCTWKGRGQHLLADHVKENHSDYIKRQGMFEIPRPTTGRSCIRYSLIKAEGQLFWQAVKKDRNQSKISWVVQYIGPHELACHFKFQIDFVSLKLGRHLTLRDFTHRIDETIDNIFCTGRGLDLPFRDVNRFNKSKTKLYYRLKIFEV